MKLSTAAVLIATMASAAAKSLTGAAAKSKILRTARRVEQDEQDAQEEQEYGFLANYDVKMVACKHLDSPIYNEEGEAEYEALLLRLCPSDDCDSDETKGCTSGYGDMLVPLTTFVEAYFEDQRDNMNWDDAFEVDKFSKCEQYNPDENADDGNQGQWENYQFFIGPTCSEEGDDVELALFTDEYCSQKSEYEFETVSNGWSLPYSDGGLVSNQCSSCTEYNDNGEQELREMCMQSYMDAPYKCEESMEYTSYYGANVQGCEVIAEMFPKAESSGSGGKIVGWIILALVVVGLIGYIVWWRKKKSTSE